MNLVGWILLMKNRIFIKSKKISPVRYNIIWWILPLFFFFWGGRHSLANRPDLLCVVQDGARHTARCTANSQERLMEWRRCKHPDPPIMASEGPHPLPPAPQRSPLKLHPPQALFSTPPPHKGTEKTKEIMAL